MRIVFFIVALLALAFWVFAAFDMWAVLTAWPPYAEQYGADMFAWIQGFPLWRKAAWGTSVGFGVIGSLMMLARVRGAGSVLLLAWLLMAGGLVSDVVMQDGVQNYGQQGMIASGVLIVLAALFAWAGFAATAKSSKPAMVASSPPAQAVTAPEPTPQAAPSAAVAPAATPVEAPPASVEAPATPVEAPLTATAAAPIEPEPSVPDVSEGPAPDSDAVSVEASASQEVSTGAEDNGRRAPPLSTHEEIPMIRRRISRDGREVNAIGLGCMGMSAYYGAPMAERDGVALLHAAIEKGVDHFDTAEMYGFGANEQLLGAAFYDRRDKVFIATKWGPVADPVTKLPVGYDGSEANARRAVENSLRYLRTDHIDLYYLHRKDPATPIEESVGAMAKLVEEGKVRAIGLSEVSADTLRKAHQVHPIAAVQSEYSLFTRDYEADVIPACKELGATFVAYSPLGRGMLTGAFAKDWKPEGPDFRSVMAPRFAGEALEANLALVAEVEALAAAKKVNAGQIALAWVLSRGEHIVAIPGTTKLANLESNLAAASVTFSADEAKRLESLAARVQGQRYNERGMGAVNA